MENYSNETEETTSQQADESNDEPNNHVRYMDYLEQLRLEQNLPLGILAGLVASVLGGFLWAVVTVATEYQIGYMAVAIGFMVGFAVRFSGKGIDKIFGVCGAALSLFGCLLGNLLSLVGFAANQEGLGYFETFNLINLSVLPEIMISGFSPMDILFYGIAIYEGYRFSFRQIPE